MPRSCAVPSLDYLSENSATASSLQWSVSRPLRAGASSSSGHRRKQWAATFLPGRHAGHDASHTFSHLRAADWVGTSKWTPAINDRFSFFEQLYAELIKCLKAQGNEQKALMSLRAAREDDVTAAIDRVLTVRLRRSGEGSYLKGL